MEEIAADTTRRPSVVPENVLEQIHFWEEDLNCVSPSEGVMIKGFDTAEQYKQFVAAAKSERIYLYSSDAIRVVICKNTTTEHIVTLYQKM